MIQWNSLTLLRKGNLRLGKNRHKNSNHNSLFIASRWSSEVGSRIGGVMVSKNSERSLTDWTPTSFGWPGNLGKIHVGYSVILWCAQLSGCAAYPSGLHSIKGTILAQTCLPSNCFWAMLRGQKYAPARKAPPFSLIRYATSIACGDESTSTGFAKYPDRPSLSVTV